MSFKKEGQITPMPMQDFIGLIYMTPFWRFHLMMDYSPSQDSIPSLARNCDCTDVTVFN